jgi:predicted DNA-binding transcriptional regulator AlpA
MDNPAPTLIVATPEQFREIIRDEFRSLLAELRPAPAGDQRQVFDFPAAAEFTEFSESSLRRAMQAGTLKPTRQGRAVRFLREELEKFLAGQTA